MRKDYSVLLYYYYTPVEDPEALREAQERFCQAHNLLGRIIVAPEGLNGTVSGIHADCEAYMDYVLSDPRFAKMRFKVHGHHGHAFPALHVRTKREIVHAGIPNIRPYAPEIWETAAGQGMPAQASVPTPPGIRVNGRQLEEMRREPDVVLLDVRSNYEHRLGRFKGSITLDIENFRDFPDRLAELLPYKDKKIITICTGNVKCEKASAYLLQQGFPHVYQLEGGIIQYGLDTEGREFEGSCYVFDNRITVQINKESPTIIDRCCHCQQPCERVVNCANPQCHRHFSLCHACGEALEGACSPACKAHPEKRPYHPSGYYLRREKGQAVSCPSGSGKL